VELSSAETLVLLDNQQPFAPADLPPKGSERQNPHLDLIRVGAIRHDDFMMMSAYSSKSLKYKKAIHHYGSPIMKFSNFAICNKTFDKHLAKQACVYPHNHQIVLKNL
jgi:hypothetical protein